VVEERERPYDEEAVEVYMKKSPEQLYDWWKTWDLKKPLIERDSLVEAMKRSGLYPSEPMEGVYPDVLDPKFTTYLLEKKEFADLRSKASEEDLCGSSTEFDTTAVQRLIARFMNPSTPYTSALLYHGVGVGKTCTAITVAESFLKILPDKKVFILAPPSVADNFYRTIFNIRKLVSLPKHERSVLGRRWNSLQCTGLLYLSMTDMLHEKDISKIAKEVEGMIKKRYTIMGYGAFANYIKKQILGRIPAHIIGEERIRLENEELYNLFSDHLLIIDEAHNLRIDDTKAKYEVNKQAVEDAAQGKLVRTMLERILPVAEGLRLLLMTATPMYNLAPEIIGLFNLLILNDTKNPRALLNRDTFFTKKGKDFEFIKEMEPTIQSIAGRYVSYMRGENPYSFPLRLSPPNMIGDRIRTEYPSISLLKKEATLIMEPHLQNILKSLPLVVTSFDSSTRAGTMLHTILDRYHKSAEEIEEEDGINRKVFSQLTSATNILYPDGSSGNEGWRHYFISEEFGELPRLLRYRWDTARNPDTTVDTVFGTSILHEYAPKLATIVRSLKTCKGISFVYSQFLAGGIIPFAIALERAGWTRVLANGHAESLLVDPPSLPYGRQCALCEHHEHSHTGDHSFSPANFILLTGVDKHTPSVDAAVQYATTFPKEDSYAPYGSRVKAILGSSVTSEGLDFKCIREIHIIDPWWHLNEIEQIIGRGVRYCSHARLPLEERTCTIYLHVAKLASEYETPDLYTYRIAAKKSIQIGTLQRAIKIGAFDCNIHHDVLFIGPGKTRTIRDGQGKTIHDYPLMDKQYSSFCDFMETCKYTCSTSIDPSIIGSDLTTFTANDLMRYLDIQFNKLKLYYQSSSILYLPLQYIKEEFFKDIPSELVALGLRSRLKNTSFIIEQADGTRGVLELQNGYLVFKPLEITDPEIPLALRHGYAYGRLPTRMISPLLLTKSKTITSVSGEEGTEFRLTKSVEEKAFLRLEEWSKEIRALMNPTHALDVRRRVPEGIPESIYRLLQWMPHRFRNFLYIEKILMQFYMDRIWSIEERQSVFAAITERRGTGTVTPMDDTILSYVTNPEVFNTPEGIYGFISIHSNGQDVRYCKIGTNPVAVAPPSINSLIDPVLEPPLNGLTGCSPLYGFHVFYKTMPMFKILNTEKLNPRNRVFTGSNCTITSNLDRMLEDIMQLYKYQKDPKYILLEPLILQQRTTKEKADPYMYINQLRSPELCMYTEILLRAFQSVEPTSMRWILSIVDAKRAVETRIVKGKPVKKFIFENSFMWKQ